MDVTDLALLKEQYTTKTALATELINLEAILSLPKSTEAFISDVHGEYDAFQHVLRNGSGNVKQKVADLFSGKMTPQTISSFSFLIYYPSERLAAIKKRYPDANDLHQWYLDTFQRLVELLHFVSTKYTRSKVRKALAPEFVYITEELLYGDFNSPDKAAYYQQITENIIALKQADEFIIASCHTIQRLVVDHLHLVGDIYDRGPHPELIMERLMQYHSLDIQWGNHDILWLGAVSGSRLCLANLLRICARYNNLSIIEDAYGINLRHLSLFAEEHYQDNVAFRPKQLRSERPLSKAEELQITQIHQAIAIIQFKLEGPVIARRPEFKMAHRRLLDRIDYQKMTIQLHGKIYPLENTCFQTVDPTDPYKLLPEEKRVIDQLLAAFRHSDKLQRHMKFLMRKGSMYLTYNDNLLFHGCIPVTADGKFQAFKLHGKEYAGKALLDVFEQNLRASFAHPGDEDDCATDLLWYLWTGPLSPLFGKHDMTTFERYFISDPATHEERTNPYYKLRREAWFVDSVLREFGMSPATGHVINGHTPVKKGQTPVMADRKMIVIDGGFSKPYHKTTGIGGYTLLYNSYGMQLVTHQPFTSKADAIANLTDIISTKRIVDQVAQRKLVAETDIGAELKQQVAVLRQLLADKE
ncbi:fructose-1,6-bisphosphatase [Loigolactobacillus coryniformis subsp. coryniformis]|jgi:fructose-1,6-bisphosphatase-3|nr:fructose-1,6-bisphosphatase [Loigolactobacillus coryniformis]ATO44453.1 fructose-1,6-bisphosphatase [Loigolactobacillus coryniformis subsp. torquens DSM 20004 = KCTC 3535]KRK85347.1 fructose-1,6-bisphosphatase [Loigolactobacillus coryniformis subsp. torquens DSM 20004 = KCTC 3535]MCL5457978.1 fructose-1,6-bisphosphatase [Loigolactobacillus coryniformis]MDN5951262.1 fructose-1,6-bisphosphatase [Loigolactobacillus coryniformis]MDN5953665.1 fructose-1,6-bisphosphatase [Loigolactobacillus coryn